jgi:hypothetical protein
MSPTTDEKYEIKDNKDFFSNPVYIPVKVVLDGKMLVLSRTSGTYGRQIIRSVPVKKLAFEGNLIFNTTLTGLNTVNYPTPIYTGTLKCTNEDIDKVTVTVSVISRKIRIGNSIAWTVQVNYNGQLLRYKSQARFDVEKHVIPMWGGASPAIDTGWMDVPNIEHKVPSYGTGNSSYGEYSHWQSKNNIAYLVLRGPLTGGLEYMSGSGASAVFMHPLKFNTGQGPGFENGNNVRERPKMTISNSGIQSYVYNKTWEKEPFSGNPHIDSNTSKRWIVYGHNARRNNDMAYGQSELPSSVKFEPRPKYQDIDWLPYSMQWTIVDFHSEGSGKGYNDATKNVISSTWYTDLYGPPDYIDRVTSELSAFVRMTYSGRPGYVAPTVTFVFTAECPRDGNGVGSFTDDIEATIESATYGTYSSNWDSFPNSIILTNKHNGKAIEAIYVTTYATTNITDYYPKTVPGGVMYNMAYSGTVMPWNESFTCEENKIIGGHFEDEWSANLQAFFTNGASCIQLTSRDMASPIISNVISDTEYTLEYGDWNTDFDYAETQHEQWYNTYSINDSWFDPVPGLVGTIYYKQQVVEFDSSDYSFENVGYSWTTTNNAYNGYEPIDWDKANAFRNVKMTSSGDLIYNLSPIRTVRYERKDLLEMDITFEKGVY